MPGGQGLGDLIEDRGDDPFDIPLIEMGIPGRLGANQLLLVHPRQNNQKTGRLKA
jgi:hypothetical protein